MGTAEVQGELWSSVPEDWANIQEPMHTPLWERMLDQASVGAGTKVLDAGCGGGGASVLAAQRGAQVFAIDAAPGLIQFARDRVRDGEFRVGDIEHLPFESDSFDAIIAANSLQYTEDRVAALREMARVCAPGGRIVAGLFGPAEKVTFGVVFEAIRNAMPEPPSGGGPFELSAPGKLELLFEEADLSVEEVGEVDCPFRYPDFETFWRAQASAGPMQGPLKTVGAETLKSALRDSVEPFQHHTGELHIGPNLFKYVVAAA